MSPAPTSTAAVVDTTVTVLVPVTPPLVALIAAVPVPHPVTSPVPETFATVESLVDQMIKRSLSGLPALSRGVAVSWTSSACSTLAGLGLTSTDATVAPGVVP